MAQHSVFYRIRKPLYVALGLVFTGLGIVGAVVPLMPTTVFLLLAAFFFSRSSERFLHWLLHNKICGQYIRNFREHRGMFRKDKVRSLALMWVTVILSCLAIADRWWLKGLIIAIVSCVSVYILRLKTLSDV